MHLALILAQPGMLALPLSAKTGWVRQHDASSTLSGRTHIKALSRPPLPFSQQPLPSIAPSGRRPC